MILLRCDVESVLVAVIYFSSFGVSLVNLYCMILLIHANYYSPAKELHVILMLLKSGLLISNDTTRTGRYVLVRQ